MGEEKKENGKAGRIDSFFVGVADYIGKQISRFVAFLFFVFTAGAVYGALLAYRQVQFAELFIILPAALGIIAYYNRTFALVIFIAVVLLFVVI